ncbi:MAG TPA: acyltransferase family protein [Gaiellaceae bacterium]|nr:acyltransferase family protein [Gaiellaceae bacterium]
MPGRVMPRRRRADIQGLRALAVLLVVAFHSGLPLRGGFTGVDVFFAISGFVITTTLLAELSTSGTIGLPRFYLRRAKRLLPALALMLVFVAMVGILADPFGAQHVAGLTGGAASLFGANLYLYSLPTGYFDVGTNLNPLLHTWTLAVEEQFYLVFPACLLAAWLLGAKIIGRPRAMAFLVMAAIAVPSFVLASRLTQGVTVGGIVAPQRFAYYSSPSRAWEFAAGSLAALLLPAFRKLPLLAGTALGTLGFGLIVFGAVAITGAGFSPTEALVPVTGTIALLAAGFASENAVSRLLSRRPIVRLGDLSYSWYLWHWPLIVFAVALWPRAGYLAPLAWVAPPLAALVALVPSFLSYKYVECPVRYSSRFTARRAFAVAAACVTVPIIASAGMLAAHAALERSKAFASWKQAAELHADFRRECDSPIPLGSPKRAQCLWRAGGAGKSKGTIVLIGDSNAGQFTEPLTRAAQQAGYDAEVATLSACPFVTLEVYGTGSGEANCARFVKGSLRALLGQRPRASLVVIAARSDLYVNGSAISLASPGTTPTSSSDIKAALWREGLHAILRRLNRAGIPVVVVQPVPVIPHVDPQACAALLILANACAGSVPRTAADNNLRLVDDSEQQAEAGLKNTSSLSVENDLCSAHACSSERGGVVMYRDSNHLSILGAMTLEPQFFKTIIAHAKPLEPASKPAHAFAG